MTNFCSVFHVTVGHRGTIWFKKGHRRKKVWEPLLYQKQTLKFNKFEIKSELINFKK